MPKFELKPMGGISVPVPVNEAAKQDLSAQILKDMQPKDENKKEQE